MNIFYHTLVSPDPHHAPTWTYSARCSNCDQPIGRAVAPSIQRAKPTFSRRMIPLCCPSCHHQAWYDADWAAPLL